MLRNLLLATLLLAAIAGCRIKGDPQTERVASTCTTAGDACFEHADCCSFACVSGICIANVVEGGVCRSNDDCSYTMRCISGNCRSGFTCNAASDPCSANNDCCSGNCVGENNSNYPPTPGLCGVEHAPTVDLGGPLTVPYYATAALTAHPSDIDAEDVFYYAWSVVSVDPPGGLSVGWTSTSNPATFFPSQKGTYTLRLRVTDGPSWQASRSTVEDQVVVYAVNLPPVVDADPVPIATTLRNQPVTLTGSVSDPNGTATPVSCAWYARRPSGSETAIVGGSWTSCPASPSVSFTPPRDEAEGNWTFRLEAFDGEFVSSDSRVIQVVNAPPVAAACPGCAPPPDARVGNLGPPGKPAPSIPLSGSATDANDDIHSPSLPYGQFSWQWIVDSVPSGSSTATGVLDSGYGPPPFVASFEPDANVTGTYVLRLHVDDRRGGSDDDTVDVVVEPYLRPLHELDGVKRLPRGDVADAAYVHATDRIVFAGYDASTLSNRLWVLDPESAPTTFGPSAALSSTTRCLGVTPDGSEATVGQDGYWQKVTQLTGTPAAQARNPFGYGFAGTPTEIVYSRRLYATSSSGSLHELGTSAGSSSAPAGCTGTCTPASGTRAVAGVLGSDYVWTLKAAGELRRYLASSNGNLDQNPATVASGLSAPLDLWVTAVRGATQAEVVTGDGTVFNAATVTSLATLPFQVIHLDSTAVSTALQAVAVSTANEVHKLDATFASAGLLPLPRIGYLGTGYPVDAQYAFVRTDGSAHYVVFRSHAAIDGAYRWYLMKY